MKIVALLEAVCVLAGSISFLDDTTADIRAERLDKAVATHDTAAIFNWLVKTFSYQGISDAAARGFMETNGSAEWLLIDSSLTTTPSCPKLRSYWHFDACGYGKGRRTCGEPSHFNVCPLPRFPLRNGRLNQTAYSLFLFIRDIAGGDLVAWIESQLASSCLIGQAKMATLQEALIGPLRNVYGVSDKVLNMALSSLFLGLREQRPDWFEIGTGMLAIDTLVHNFLHRTGVLENAGQPHLYGPACYQPGGCADIIRQFAHHIDARKFNRSFPSIFPRFVQHAIWRFCAADGLNICNGVQIDDRFACANCYCQLGKACSKVPLKAE